MDVLRSLHWLFYITCAYIIGISIEAVTRSVATSPLTFISILISIVCYHVYTSHKKHLFFLVILLLFFFLGAWLYHRQYSYHHAFQQLIQNTTSNVMGTVINIENTPKYLSTILTIAAHTLDNTHLNYYTTIMVYTRCVNNIHIGDTIQLHKVQFKRIQNQSFQEYLIKKNCSAVVFMHQPCITIITPSTYSIWHFLHAQREKIYNTIKSKLNKKHFALIEKIFFGGRNASQYYTKQIREYGNHWGIAHYFARSGLHLVIFIFICHFIFQFIPLPFLSKQIMIIIWGIVYYILSWPSISFNRAFLSFLLYKIGVVGRLQTDLLHLLTVVCFIVLLFNPIQLLFLDFQLSFGLTCALAILNHTTKSRR